MDAKLSNDPDDITIRVKPESTESDSDESYDKTFGVTYSSGVDWLSMTTTDGPTELEFYRMFKRYSERFPVLEVPWSHFGGFHGRECNQMAVGTSENYGTLIKSSGKGGDDLFRFAMLANLKDIRVTRIDLRVDLFFSPNDEMKGVIEELYRENKDSKARKYTFMDNSNGGSTLYVGSMSSNVFGRIYDKGVERGTHSPGTWIRLEVVNRKPLGDEVYQLIEEEYKKNGSATDLIRDYVVNWFNNRNAVIVSRETIVEEVTSPREETPLERKLKWLERSVRKTVDVLRRSGYDKEVREALGIDLPI